MQSWDGTSACERSARQVAQTGTPLALAIGMLAGTGSGAMTEAVAASSADDREHAPASGDVQYRRRDAVGVLTNWPDTPRTPPLPEDAAVVLDFLRVSPDASVVEIASGDTWPARGLALQLAHRGLLFVARPSAQAGGLQASDEFSSQVLSLAGHMTHDRAVCGKVVIVPFAPPAFSDIGPPGGADHVVIDAALSAWTTPTRADTLFKASFEALKPGGVLSIVSWNDKDNEAISRRFVARARRVGFEARSETGEPSGFYLQESLAHIAIRLRRPDGSHGG